MNVSINWLKEYIDFDFSPEVLADRLLMLGVETESIKQLGEGLVGVVVGRINAVRNHPNANKLVLCDVDVAQDADLQIVCGAPNAREGLIAPVALVGTRVATGLTVKAAKIRGEESRGMLCSEKELGIGDDASGLMTLSDELPIGAPLAEAFGLDDAVLELEITPNRPDCLSMIGIAREIGAETGNPVKPPSDHVNEGTSDVRDLTGVIIDAPELCPRYAARVIRGVRIAPSPQWLQRKLESIDVGSINNVVDITNFVLMECGHPLHAFDYHKLAENRIVVRRAAPNESLTTIDETERKLTSDMLVIADAEKPVALAGVMGGFDSEISDQTVDVLLESAYFHPPSIRKTSKSLSMHTEASHRFERGADPEGVIPALNRAAQLIAEIAGGEIATGIIDVYPGKREPVQVKLRPERANFVLGTQISSDEMVEILTRLGFEVSLTWEVTVPTFRPDVSREIDLIEEIARVHGYDNIPTTMPAGDVPAPPSTTRSDLREHVKAHLIASGMTEAVNYSFYDPRSFDRLRLEASDGLRDALKIRNPLSEEMSIMRTTLVPSLLENTQRNRNHRVENIQLFEISKVFVPSGDSDLPNEPECVAGVIAGNIGAGVHGDPYRSADFFDIKGIVEGLLDVCGISDYTFASTRHPLFHPGRNASVKISGQPLGVFGEIHPEVQQNYDLEHKAYLFEFEFDVMADAASLTRRVEPISIYPSVNRDIAIVLDAEIQANRPVQLIRSAGGDLVKSVRLFDLYIGDQVPDGKKSLAYAIEYSSPTETLTDEQVDRVHDGIVKRLNKELGAELRS
ncbi:MAG: phenylalanine--tRNA ligase subunit beta [Candidatus Poribacteria bacterium]|nr:phenylalanine--tRNA ligase subunit beta [Candidatus Poribacteria bacterium]MDE0506844.1 phenylalanine--tRNA ligase subunit beta [Candidatus Poribacteria bacterium]